MAPDYNTAECSALCSNCSVKGCPNYKPRTGYALFLRVVLGVMVCALGITVVVCSFMVLRWTTAHLGSDRLPDTVQSTKTELTCGLGVSVMEVGSMAEGAGIEGGLVIMYLNEQNSFEGHDVKVNDVILAAEGVTVVTVYDLWTVLLAHEPGDEICVTVARFEDGTAVSRELFVTLVPLSEA